MITKYQASHLRKLIDARVAADRAYEQTGDSVDMHVALKVEEKLEAYIRKLTDAQVSKRNTCNRPMSGA